MRNLLTKTLYDKRWFMFGWALAFALTALMVVVFFPSFQDSFDYDQISKQLPSGLQGLLGSAESMKTVHGYISAQLYDIRLPLFLLIMTIVLGLSLTIADEESGRLRTTASLPIGRQRLFVYKWLAGISVVGVISAASLVGVYAGLLIIGESAPHVLLLKLTGLTWLFGAATLGIVIGVGLGTGKRGLTMTLSLVATVGSFLLTTFGASVSWLKPWERLSLLHYFNASSLARGEYPPQHLIVLVLVLLVSLVVGLMLFRRRDIA